MNVSQGDGKCYDMLYSGESVNEFTLNCYLDYITLLPWLRHFVTLVASLCYLGYVTLLPWLCYFVTLVTLLFQNKTDLDAQFNNHLNMSKIYQYLRSLL